MKFGERLQELRRAAGLTQQEVAERLELTVGAVRDYEQGRRIPSWPVLVRISRIIGATANDFSDCDEVAEPESKTPPPAKGGGKRKPG